MDKEEVEQLIKKKMQEGKALVKTLTAQDSPGLDLAEKIRDEIIELRKKLNN